MLYRERLLASGIDSGATLPSFQSLQPQAKAHQGLQQPPDARGDGKDWHLELQQGAQPGPHLGLDLLPPEPGASTSLLARPRCGCSVMAATEPSREGETGLGMRKPRRLSEAVRALEAELGIWRGWGPLVPADSWQRANHQQEVVTKPE